MMWVMLFTLGKSINRSGADETWDIIGVQHNIFHNFQKGYLLCLVEEKNINFTMLLAKALDLRHISCCPSNLFLCEGKIT